MEQWNGTVEWNSGMEQWNGIWNGTVEWSRKGAQLQLTFVTGAAQSRLSYLLHLNGSYLTIEAV